MSNVSIELSRGLVAQIDAVDFDRVRAHRWCASGRHPHLYAVTNLPMMNGSRSQLAMHRLIVRAPAGMVVDHINGDTLDNRRTNLRVCAHRKNIASSRSRTLRSRVMNNPYTALAAIIRESWLDKAACGPETAHLFETYTGRHTYWDARKICLTCPVRQQCLDHAIAHDETTGIWGGKTPEQRRHLKVVS